MGNSLPPPAGIDLVGSYARLRGADAELVLSEPKAMLVHDRTSVVLQKGGVNVTGSVQRLSDEAGTRLHCRVPRSELADGTWSILLRSASDEPVDARLLVQGRRPLVLLWGARGGASFVPRGRRGGSRRKTLAATAGRALDAVLQPLPPERAVQTRRTARRIARQLLG